MGSHKLKNEILWASKRGKKKRDTTSELVEQLQHPKGFIKLQIQRVSSSSEIQNVIIRLEPKMHTELDSALQSDTWGMFISHNYECQIGHLVEAG